MATKKRGKKSEQQLLPGEIGELVDHVRTRNGTPPKKPAATPSGYQPLCSIWDGSDAALLELMLDFYPRKPPKLILDATVNAGRFWVGSHRKVIGMDIDPRHQPDVLGDNMQMPFKDSCFDVVV